MAKVFGDFLEPAKQELNRFIRQENYIKGLSETYRLLIQNAEVEINCLEQSAAKHNELLINQRQLTELCQSEPLQPEIEKFDVTEEHPWSIIAESQRQTARQIRHISLNVWKSLLDSTDEASKALQRWRATV